MQLISLFRIRIAPHLGSNTWIGFRSKVIKKTAHLASSSAY